MKRINVTKTYLGNKSEFLRLMDEVWDSGWITNHGPKVLELEHQLKEYLGVKHLFFVNNGTIAIQIAIKALGLKEKVLTTPFSYVATTSSLVWENCQPIFIDICPDTLTIDVEKVENALKHDNFSGVLATHVYGIPCDVVGLKKLGAKYGIPIIYDAAHAFGVTISGESILNYGDISTLSFHATKVFHTIEGGALVTNDDDLAHKISYLRNFGHNGPENFFGVGINGKNNEFSAAMGLINLKEIDSLIAERKHLHNLYVSALQGLNLKLAIEDSLPGHNYSYFPVIFDSEEKLLHSKCILENHNIFPRRYFFPSLNTLPYVLYQTCPISESISRRVLCLPFYNGLLKSEIDLITDVLKTSL